MECHQWVVKHQCDAREISRFSGAAFNFGQLWCWYYEKQYGHLIYFATGTSPPNLVIFMQNSKLRVGIPWGMPICSLINGAHPLVNSFVKNNSRIETTNIGNGPLTINNQVLSQKIATLIRRFGKLEPNLSAQLLEWMAITDQFIIDSASNSFDTLFMHTTPLYVGEAPWIFHFESVPSIFMPYLFHGRCQNVPLVGHPFYQAVLEAFAAKNCQKIFTHMKSSYEILKRIFPYPEIHQKLHHVPLGIEEADIKIALNKYAGDGKVKILFTNSLHNNQISFYLRGGHLLLRAFSRIRKESPHYELTIVSSIPGNLGQYFSNEDLEGVTWYSSHIEGALMEKLLNESHVFALPAAGLHSYSFLNALSHGCIPLISDVSSYNEYTEGISDNVLLVKGVQAQIYRDEPDGWTSDNYNNYIEPFDYFSDQIYEHLLKVPEIDLLDKAKKNISHARSNFGLKASQEAFNAMLGI